MNHGPSPDSVFDLLLATAALVIVLWSFYLAVRYTFWPGETSSDHIKSRVLDDMDEGPG